MRRLRFLLIGLALASVACVKNDVQDGQKGSTPIDLTVSLSADSHTGAVITRSDSDEAADVSVPAELVPEINDFEVEIYKVDGDVRLYRDTYENTVGKTIRLNTGRYRLLAEHGNPLGCGFNRPYFVAEKQFELTAEVPKQSVSATAVLGNVQLGVSYDKSVPGSYFDYYVIVRHQDHASKYVKFSRNEERYGYIPAGNVVIEFYADLTGNDDWMYSCTSVKTYDPRDHVNISISVEPRMSKVYFNLSVDDEETVEEDTFAVPEWAAPQDAPSLTLSGFDENNECEVIEGVDVGAGGSVSILARAAISNCFLTVDSDILARKGLPAGEYDLVNLDDATEAKVKGAGIDWDDNMPGSRTLSFINFAEAFAILNDETRSSTQRKDVARFSLRVVDMVGKEGTVDFSVVSVPINPVLSIPTYNVWATKVVRPQISISEGANRKLFRLQMSKDQNRWTNLENEISGTGLSLHAEDITGLDPDTRYYFRVIYNDNPLVVSDAKSVVTEEALQIKNSGFDTFVTATHSYKSNTGGTGGSTYTRNYYLPYDPADNDKWWAVNSMMTMPDQTTDNYHNYKVFPTVTYTSTQGNRHAQIATVYISNLATPDSDKLEVGGWFVSEVKAKAVGELFLGVAKENGEPDIERLGHKFASRPAAFSFDYWYTPINDEKFYVRIDILDADGNVLAEHTKTDGGAVNGWTTCVLPLNYKSLEKKASSIRLSFRSSTLSHADAGYASNSKVSISVAGSTEEARLGSILLVDNLELIYE